VANDAEDPLLVPVQDQLRSVARQPPPERRLTIQNVAGSSRGDDSTHTTFSIAVADERATELLKNSEQESP
jgi:hypothetical protein